MNDYDMKNLIENYCIEDDRVVDAIKAKYSVMDKDRKRYSGLIYQKKMSLVIKIKKKRSRRSGHIHEIEKILNCFNKTFLRKR